MENENKICRLMRLPAAAHSQKMVKTIKYSRLNFMCTHGVMLLARFATSILIPYVPRRETKDWPSGNHHVQLLANKVSKVM